MNPLSFGVKLASNPLDISDKAMHGDVTLRLGNNRPVIFNAARMEAEIALIPGQHAVNATGRSAQFGIRPGTNARIALSVARKDSEFILEHIQIDFSRPVQLLNIFTTMDEIGALIAESPGKFLSNFDIGDIRQNNEFINKASALIETNAKKYADMISESSAWKFLKNAAERNHLAENIEKSKEYSKWLLETGKNNAESALDKLLNAVVISALEIRSFKKNGQWRLSFHITGSVGFNTAVRRDFEHYQVPEILLPEFDARLPLLLDQFSVDREQGGNLSRTLLAMLQHASGKCAVELCLCPLPFELSMRAGGKLKLHIQTHRAIKLDAQFDVDSARDGFCFNVRANAVSPGCQAGNMALKFAAAPDTLIRLSHALDPQTWMVSFLGTGKDMTGDFNLENGFQLAPDFVEIYSEIPELKTQTRWRFQPENAQFGTHVVWGIDIEKRIIHLHTFDSNILAKANFVQTIPVHIHGADAAFDHLDLSFGLSATRNADGETNLTGTAQASFDAQFFRKTKPLPELGLIASNASLKTSGVLALDILMQCPNANDAKFSFNVDGSCGRLHLNEISCRWDVLKMEAPSGADIGLFMRHGECTNAGISDCDIGLNWHFKKPPIIEYRNATGQLFPDEFCTADIDATISENGVLEFHNGSCFYNAVFFNTLLRPNIERSNWRTILTYKPLCDFLFQLGKATFFPCVEGSEDFCKRVIHWIERCEDENIFRAATFVHPDTLAHAISLFLFDDDSATQQILPSIQMIFHAEGIDRFAIEALLERAFPKASLDYAGRVLKWLHHLFLPVDYAKPKTTHARALCDDTRYLEPIVALPTANDVYTDNWNHDIALRCESYACGLSDEEISHILQHHTNDLTSEKSLEKFRILHDIQTKIRHFEPQEGSVIIQDFNIAVFLGRLLEADSALWLEKKAAGADDDVCSCFCTWLSPIDVARLMGAGIASRYQGLFVQLNQNRLFEYLKLRGKTFAIAVFYEIGAHSTRILFNKLTSWLSQDQELLCHHVDRAAELSALLNIAIPERTHYQSGGITPSASYIEAVFDACEQIIDSSQPYRAACIRMKSYRFETPDAPSSKNHIKAARTITEIPKNDEAALQNAMNDAQRLSPNIANATAFETLSPDKVKNAKQAWGDALACAQNFSKHTPQPYHSPIYKILWNSLFESLRVHSVLDDIVHRYDETRLWFATRIGIHERDIDQYSHAKLIEKIIRLIYAKDEDRQKQLHNPLVWFLPDIPQGDITLSIIAAMGIITNGKNGHELSAVFERLEKTRHVRILRANTGTIQPLDYNADRIIELLHTVDGPFAMIGYSQGCANMMRAESRMIGGTPQDRSIISRLVSRNFICSAFNGSAHAVCGLQKYKNALIEAESILKSISGTLSKTLADKLFKGIERILDTTFITVSLDSVEALSPEGLCSLSRDAQYQSGVISLETQGASTQMPEALVIMASHYDKQAHTPNDSQVDTESAHAYPVFNHNDSVDMLCDEAIPSATLNLHHWAPLVEEVQFIETQLDIENCAYKGPKSIFVTPWIDSLIFMGILSTH